MRTVHWLYCNSLLEDVISTEISCFNPNRKITVQFENKASGVCTFVELCMKSYILLARTGVRKMAACGFLLKSILLINRNEQMNFMFLFHKISLKRHINFFYKAAMLIVEFGNRLVHCNHTC